MASITKLHVYRSLQGLPCLASWWCQLQGLVSGTPKITLNASETSQVVFFVFKPPGSLVIPSDIDEPQMLKVCAQLLHEHGTRVLVDAAPGAGMLIGMSLSLGCKSIAITHNDFHTKTLKKILSDKMLALMLEDASLLPQDFKARADELKPAKLARFDNKDKQEETTSPAKRSGAHLGEGGSASKRAAGVSRMERMLGLGGLESAGTEGAEIDTASELDPETPKGPPAPAGSSGDPMEPQAQKKEQKEQKEEDLAKLLKAWA